MIMAMGEPLSFGLWLKQRRRLLDLTQDKLAKKANCSLVTVRKIESGDLLPSKELAVLIANALGVPTADRDAFVSFARSERIAAPATAYSAQTKSVAAFPLANAVPDALPPPTFSAPTGRTFRVPAPLTALVGREWEVQASCALLRRSTTRLMTLTGPPGAGKTRLGLAIAEALNHEFADGVCFVSLAPINDAALVMGVIAQSLGVRAAAHDPALQATVHDFLADRQLVLVLDNFEQVIAAADELAALLMAAPGVKVLVTSRALLKIYGEHEFPVPPLTLPMLSQLPATGDLLLYSAIELFVQRAQAAQPAFALTPENATAVVQICQALDGLPLALELAAARIKWQPPSVLLAQLRQRLAVLTGGPRHLAPRQQTLHNAIEWSYILLADEERRLFNVLAVFVGGCTPEAVAAVADVYDNGQSGRADLQPEALIALSEKSLLQHEMAATGEIRYFMLETLREFAAGRLAASGELTLAQQRHAAFFVGLAQRAEPFLRVGEEQMAWFTRIEADLHNLRALVGRVLSHELEGASDLVLHVVIDLDEYWDTRGHYREVRQWAEAAVALSPPSNLSARALNHAGRHAWRQGDFVASRQLHAQALAIQQALADRAGMANSLRGLAIVAIELDDDDHAEALLQECVEIKRALGDLGGVTQVLINLANLARKQGHYERAEGQLREALQLREQIGDQLGRRYALTGLGRVALRRGQYEEAAQLFRQSFAISFALKDRRAIAGVLECLAAALAGLEDGLTAVRLFGVAQRLREEVGTPTYIDGKTEYERDVASAQALLDEASFAAAWAAGRALSLDEAAGLALGR